MLSRIQDWGLSPQDALSYARDWIGFQYRFYIGEQHSVAPLVQALQERIEKDRSAFESLSSHAEWKHWHRDRLRFYDATTDETLHQHLSNPTVEQRHLIEALMRPLFRGQSMARILTAKADVLAHDQALYEDLDVEPHYAQATLEVAYANWGPTLTESTSFENQTAEDLRSLTQAKMNAMQMGLVRYARF